MLQIPNINCIFSLSFNQISNNLRNLKQFIILSLNDSTQIYELIRRSDKIILEEIKYENTCFIKLQKTITCARVSESVIVQATEDKLVFMHFDFNEGTFKLLQSIDVFKNIEQINVFNESEIILADQEGLLQVQFGQDYQVVK